MRLILFFDLPVEKVSQRKSYAKFVKDIKKLGFYMLQESVYLKLCSDSRMASSIETSVEKIAPSEGSVAILTVTEKQFSEMNFVVGEHYTDVLNTDERITEL
ncbi:MAG: CRISPR-associated endonuclease Cas2 [Erysipelotrichaceae bacterium]|nr:CRISPR-associated endonuclease Cas2 [Erysipelotrichaceae bacterium]